MAFTNAYTFQSDEFEAGQDLVNYSFESFRAGNISSALNQYYEGPNLAINILEIERVPELRFSTVDTEEVNRRWSLSPSGEETELLLLRLKVENHQTTNATFNVDQNAAVLRDLVNGSSYRPLTISSTVYQDKRGETEALVRLDQGQCFDPVRFIVETGTQIRWINEGTVDYFIRFADTGVAVGPGGRARIPSGDSLSHTIDQTGVYPYICGAERTAGSNAEVVVVEQGSRSSVREREMLFLDGPFELPRGTQVDGWLVFEVPKDAGFRDFRWRAGDLIIIEF